MLQRTRLNSFRRVNSFRPATVYTGRYAVPKPEASEDPFTPPPYLSLIQGFNQRWRSVNCEKVYLPKNGTEARLALEDAVSTYAPGQIKFRSGGHCYEDFVDNAQTKAIIDCSQLLDVGYDEEKGYYLGSGESNWSAFNKVFRMFNKVIPGGSCYSVGLGGHITGGGYGIMSRLHGATVDWVTGVEAVLLPTGDGDPVARVYVGEGAEGDIPTVADDLLWAHKGGGGGNFGLVTRFYFKKLPDAPLGALITNFKFDWKNLDVTKLKTLLDWYVNFASSKDPKDWIHSIKCMLWHRLHQESGRYLHLQLHSAYHNDDEQQAARLFHQQVAHVFNGISPMDVSEPPLVKLGGHGGWTGRSIVENTVGNIRDTGEYTFYESTQIMNGSGDNRRGKYKSAYMKQAFPLAQVQAMWVNLASLNAKTGGVAPGELVDSLLQIDCFGGAINEKDPGDTAMVQRNFVVKCQYQTYWKDVNKDKIHRQWMDDFYRDMYGPYGGYPDIDHPSGLFEGCFYNYPDADLNTLCGSREKALRQYFGKNLERLQKVKSSWDPQNHLQHSQSIPVLTKKAYGGEYDKDLFAVKGYKVGANKVVDEV